MIIHGYARLDEGENHNSTLWEVRTLLDPGKGAANAKVQGADGNAAKVGVRGIVAWGL